MKLIQLMELAGTPVAGMQADMRFRTADGKLEYPEQQPTREIVTLTSVEIEQRGPCCGSKPRKELGETKGPWLYVRWTNPGGADRYAGWKDEGEHASSVHLLVDGGRP